jgi:putative ABC transport system substrate-binding protein
MRFDRRAFLGVMAAATLPLPAGAARQARVGWLTAQTAESLAPFLRSFRSGLTAAGYEEGKSLDLVFRFGDNDQGRVPALAAELVALPVDVIVVQGAAVGIVAQLKLPVPVVYVVSGDPVSSGFASSLARPLNNMTGLTFMAAEFNGKRLELLRQFKPDLARVAIIANPEHPGEHLEREYSMGVAARLGLTLDYHSATSRSDLDARLEDIRRSGAGAILLFADGWAIQNRRTIIDFASSLRIPVISGWPVFAQSGALCTYGPKQTASYSRLASYVDRILKGAKPADLPIERPSVFQLTLNMRTARALEVTVPPAVLASADEIIE